MRLVGFALFAHVPSFLLSPLSPLQYLFKSYISFGNTKFLHLFHSASLAIDRFCRFDSDWFVESDMRTGAHTHVQFNSLSAFWPGLQTLYGDIASVSATHKRHFRPLISLRLSP